MYELCLRFHWGLFLRFQLTIFQHCSDNGLVPTRRQAVIWTNDGKLTVVYMYMRHFASVSSFRWRFCQTVNEVKRGWKITSHRIMELLIHGVISVELRWFPINVLELWGHLSCSLNPPRQNNKVRLRFVLVCSNLSYIQNIVNWRYFTVIHRPQKVLGQLWLPLLRLLLWWFFSRALSVVPRVLTHWCKFCFEGYVLFCEFRSLAVGLKIFDYS